MSTRIIANFNQQELLKQEWMWICLNEPESAHLSISFESSQQTSFEFNFTIWWNCIRIFSLQNDESKIQTSFNKIQSWNRTTRTYGGSSKNPIFDLITKLCWFLWARNGVEEFRPYSVRTECWSEWRKNSLKIYINKKLSSSSGGQIIIFYYKLYFQIIFVHFELGKDGSQADQRQEKTFITAGDGHMRLTFFYC